MSISTAAAAKIIVVRQPWCWLVFNGKDIENRGWQTRYRGPLLISASAKRPTKDYHADVARFAAARGVRIPAIDEMEYGGIIGQVDLVDCVTRHSSPWFEGPIGWVLRGARRIPFVPFSGRLGLIEAPAEIMARIV